MSPLPRHARRAALPGQPATSAAAVVLALGLQACSGGGEGTPTDTSSTTAVAVIARFGMAPVDGASCTVHTAGGRALATASSVRGTVDFGLLDGVTLRAEDAFHVRCTGGEYRDEATGRTVALSALDAPTVVVDGARLAIVKP